MSSYFTLNNKIAVVTGGYGHLGKAMVEILEELGAIVIVAGRSSEKFSLAFGSKNPKILFRELDVQSAGSVKDFILNIESEFGKIDIWVNNAHAARGKSQDAMSDEDWAYTMDGVLGSIHRCIRELIPTLKKQQFGKIVNISSMYGVVSPDFRLYEGDNCEPYTNPPHYGAAKAGIIQLTKYYAVYLGKYNIQVNAVTPGPFPKEVIQNDNPAFIERLSSRNPINKIGKPENLKGVIGLLSGQGSDFITGQNIIVDGGWTIW